MDTSMGVRYYFYRKAGLANKEIYMGFGKSVKIM